MHTLAEHKQLLTPDEFKERLPMIGRNGIYDLLRAGRIRSVRIGRRYLIPASELEDFVRREATAS